MYLHLKFRIPRMKSHQLVIEKKVEISYTRHITWQI